ncbi:hypothetical protein PFISCL1PPCAC_6198, partial [Pristionchus fissidentatus]
KIGSVSSRSDMRTSLIFLTLISVSLASDEIKDRVSKYLRSRASSHSNDDCSSVPPTLWCTSDTLAKKCGFFDQCQKFKKSTYNQPVLITLLYESLCPGCQKFITEELYPKVLKNFASEFAKIELVPYGNAKISPEGEITCQHGEEECNINKFESCLIAALPDQNQFVPAIHCIETQLKVKVEFMDAVEKCFETLSIGMDIRTMIQSCMVTHESANLQKAAAARTDNVYPDKHDHVPWVLFNNVSLADAQFLADDIPQLICSWYNGDTKIPYCEVEKINARTFKNDRICEL